MTRAPVHPRSSANSSSAARSTGRGWRGLAPGGVLGILCASLAACDRMVEAHWDTGVLRSRGALDWKDGEREGEWVFHYPNGERRESGSYEDGRRVGQWTQWYPNGQLRSRGERRPSPEGPSWREGPWTYWHENGIVAARGIHRRGLREGVWEMSIDSGGLDGDGSGLYHAGVRVDAPSGVASVDSDAGMMADEAGSQSKGER